ncbi:MAG: hypothetical protein P8I94_09205, partial [Emcibacteraceae bacterium]|nr:hypothetical protein [Emcibacteraceae bacterium]
FGGFIKVNAAMANKGINGIDDASGVYNADLLFAHDDKGSRFGFNAKETRVFAGITQKKRLSVQSKGMSKEILALKVAQTEIMLKHMERQTRVSFFVRHILKLAMTNRDD